KSIVWEALQQLRWQMPDWIVIPGGNLGNTSALGKALREALAAGLIDTMPRIAVAQAEGAAPFYRAFQTNFQTFEPVVARTIATAIQIGNPVNYTKARRVILETEGTVTTVSDDAIMRAKAVVDGAGIGCEPASAAGLAGIRRLVDEGVIQPGERVLTYLTGHLLKDGDANASWYIERGAARERMHMIDPTPDALDRALERVHAAL
ncbi:MAG: pyridoxal-phosphate dependent enzyme, partial [Vicinamibacterales bacterium]